MMEDSLIVAQWNVKGKWIVVVDGHWPTQGECYVIFQSKPECCLTLLLAGVDCIIWWGVTNGIKPCEHLHDRWKVIEETVEDV